MVELQLNQFELVKGFLRNKSCDTVAAYSIIENRQRGRIFVDDIEFPKSVLFWHYNGFSILSGDSKNVSFNNNIYQLLLGHYEINQRRFALIVDNSEWNSQILNLIENDSYITKDYRLKFEFDNSSFSQSDYIISTEYELKIIDDILLNKIQGTIVPSNLWDSPQAFLSGGKGFCLMDGDNIACTAFSSFIGNLQMDIGIETSENYRKKGLGVVTAAAMVSYALENGFEPVWGCSENNIGSKSTALKLGFKLINKHPFYVKNSIYK